jgi:hypothetical protein
VGEETSNLNRNTPDDMVSMATQIVPKSVCQTSGSAHANTCNALQAPAISCKRMKHLHNDEIRRSDNVVSLDAVRQQRRHIALAQADENFRAVSASFTLSDIEITSTEAERAGRVLAGLISYDQAVEEIRQQHATDES